MAITLGVGPVNNAGGGATVAVTLNGTTAGRSIVISVCWLGAVNISSVTVSGESNAALIAGSKATNTAGDQNVQHAYLNNNTGGGNKTITVNFSGSATNATVVAVEITGADTAAAVDASAQRFANTAGAIQTTLTTIAANCAIFAAVTESGTEPTAGTNFTLLSNPRPNNAFYDEDEYWLDAGAAGAKTVGFNTTDEGAFNLLSAISIKPAGGAGTTPKTFTGTDSLAGGELL